VLTELVENVTNGVFPSFSITVTVLRTRLLPLSIVSLSNTIFAAGCCCSFVAVVEPDGRRFFAFLQSSVFVRSFWSEDDDS
jgi:hypothetical protein